ncbi:uncharacterized protein LOC128858750 isoform X1 [Anastrepha ludens]|uniref:uncharacterized protein LOC128858750 isoform X1 n=1 Tax=Anastrepha ludens TaxID=28586 RepID=UPI0023B1A20F|nr:uncharacterized protein LOC128858750 isoform X1 [Anastrepha ludens]
MSLCSEEIVSNMFERDLIKAVRQYPCLYDRNNKTSEKTKLILKKCWNNVATETGETVEKCQTRWRSLRDRYVKECRNYIDRNQLTVWQYMNDLEFLRDFIESRGPCKKKYASCPARSSDMIKIQKEEPEPGNFSNTDRTDSEEEACNSSLKRSCYDSIDYESEDDETTDDVTEPKRPFIEALEESPINEPRISQSYQNPLPSRTRSRDAQGKFDLLVGTLNEYIKSRITERQKNNNQHFFGLLDTYLSKLPENEQDKLKADILIMVMNKTRED